MLLGRLSQLEFHPREKDAEPGFAVVVIQDILV